ncbi:MAG TPA: HlyD family efflux transporter periplasmic adaptor subunit [Allosphingosinicella sp.]|nr:HlyD family efflux transporter periplasmic adaptor subunit [Allosphingosinicella sp.]
MQLFRPEALRGQDRLHGDVVLVPPVSWQLIGAFLLAAVLAAAAFIASASYAKVTIAHGRLVTDRAVVGVGSLWAGTISEILVREGDEVAAGQPLARIAVAGDAGNLVTASEAGTVTAIEAAPGDAVPLERPIFFIVQGGGGLRARLAVPPAAAGFIEPGQTVRIAVDAFPFATHGTIEGRIDSISSAAVPLAGSAGEVFVALATLRQDSIRAFGRERPLRPGMTVRARITTRSRSLAELLFEPFYAAAQ